MLTLCGYIMCHSQFFVVSVLRIAFCDKKKSLTILFQASYDF